MAQVSPPDQLVSFLKGFRCTPEDKKEKRLTHTWFGDYVCTYNIPSERYPELYDLIYESAFVKNNPVYLIERFTKPASILKLDLDFEFEIDTRSRLYTEDHLKDIIKLYNKLLVENFDIPIEQINCYVFERNRGYRQKGKYKDGLHMMWPDIKLSIEGQKFLRHQFLKMGYSIFDTLSLSKNQKLDDVVDESIIDRNGWMMYGSTKPAREPYLLTRVYDYHVESQAVPKDNRYLIEHFSLYNPDKDVFPIREDRKELLAEFTKPKRPPQLGGNGKGKFGGVHRIPVGQRRVRSNNFGEDLTTVKKLVGLLSDYRAYDHKQWIEVGLCLYNIDDMLLDTWIEFSKRIKNKFVPGECEDKWGTFRHKSEAGSLGIGSLRYWAQLDDPVGYEEIQRGSLTNLLNESADGTTYTVAKVVYEMYKYQFVCTSLRHKTWYEYKGHKWHEVENGLSLSMKLSNEVLNEYLKMNQSYLSRAYMMDGAKKQPYINNTKKFLDVALKLQDITFKEKIMKECSGLFYDSKFVEKLDTKANLICFENGVYDLETKDFRDGRPEDYCSLSTMTDYTEFDMDDPENCPEIEEINRFMSQVFPIPRVREYVFLLLSSFLLGKNPNEKFHVWTGVGGNGKSKLIELFKLAFGEYAGNLPVSLLTQKRGASSSASPELARCRGKRFVDMPEPDRGNRINIGLMKELTGGDKILARQLYKEPFEFKPMFKIVLCCNDLPKVPPDDEGTWRRLRVVKFISKFTSNPKGEHQYPVDPYLADNFERWKEPFMYMLLQYHERYREEGIKEPAEVLQATKDYQRMADIYVDFLDENVVKGDDNMIIKLEEFFARYKSWYIQNYGSAGVHNMKTFRANIERKLGNYNMFGGWQGIKFRAPRDVFNEDGEPNKEPQAPEEKLDLDKMPGTNRMAIEDALLPEPTKEEMHQKSSRDSPPPRQDSPPPRQNSPPPNEKTTKMKISYRNSEPKTQTITKDANNSQKFRMRISSRSSSRAASRSVSRAVSRSVSRRSEVDLDQVVEALENTSSSVVLGPDGNKLKIPLHKTDQK